ncbi:complement factor H isoform X1 [Ictalurus furcatus]|uniref:complement factor H isoform X1 n=1 Tax=Ictalurus furcatus TaxID=66913 RepID=UPI0023500D49|nr:complement factor H isoform X1 [Ictalurus furcatus]
MQSSLAVLYIFFLARVYTSAFDDGVNSGPSSELSTCPEIPTVDNAEVSTTSFKSKYIKGDSVTYNCQQGYIGRVIFVCDGHKWQNIRNAKCSRKRCELPEDIPNGRFFLVNGTEFVYGTTIKYICKTGYRMVSRVDNRTCLAEGWNNHLPQCEEITCSLPVAKDNIIVDGLPDYDNPIRYGHQLQFTCHSTGLKLVGPKEVICGENGEWSNPFPTCEEIVCELKQINGSVAVAGLPQNNAPIKYGHKLQFYCFQKGMLLSGNKEVTCSNEGQWSSPFPICEEVTCKEGELQNVKIVYGSPGVSPPFKPRHSLNFECTNPGWTMTGQSSITCREDGTWSSPYPTCSGCGPPPHIEFADLTTLQKSYYGYGERVEYRCQQYYTIWSLYGQPFKTCAQGTWNGFVKCLKPCIVTIEDMDANNIKQYYGQKRKMYSQHGDQISFTCQSGKRPTNKVAFRQQCRDGVMHLPLCM